MEKSSGTPAPEAPRDTAIPEIPGIRRRNTTALVFGTKLTARQPPQKEMAIIVRGDFTLQPDRPAETMEGQLDPESMRGPVFADDDEYQQGECFYPGDLADFKPCGEVLVKGTARTPAGEPAPAIETFVSVGEWSKRLVIFGSRYWLSQAGRLAPSDPEPFTELALAWSHAFGGPDYRLNPAGIGMDGVRLPRIEHPRHLVTSPDDRPQPVGFGPVNANWLPRAERIGRNYGASYAKRAPFFSDDFDWNWFNAAPPDQWIDGMWRGDEAIRCAGFSTQPGVQNFALPGRRVRCFVRYRDGTCIEPAIGLDTIYVDFDEMRLGLTWRGHVPVGDEYFRDVTAMLIADENLAEAPGPDQPYLDQLARALSDPYQTDDLPEEARGPARAVLGMATGLTTAQDARQSALALAEANTKSALAGAPWGKAAAGKKLPGNPLSDYMGEKMGGFLKPAQNEIKMQLATLGKTCQQRGFDLSAHLRRVVATARASAKNLPNTGSLSPSSPPTLQLTTHFTEIAKLAAKVKGELAQRGVPADFGPIDRLIRDPRIQALSPAYSPDQVLATARAELAAEQAKAESGAVEFAPGADLRKRDLRGRDLSGFDLSGALLDQADLRQAILSGCPLRGASMVETRLDGAWLIGCDLRETDLRRASLTEAILDHARLSDARADYADFSQTHCRQAEFTNFQGPNCRFHGANLAHAMFHGADLAGAVFSQCKLDGTVWVSVQAMWVAFDGATLEHASFSECNLATLSGEDLTARLVTFDECTLSDASCLRAHIEQCRFISCQMTGFSAADARIEMSGFPESTLSGACFERTSMVMVNFGRAEIVGARFADCQASRCFWVEANIQESDFTRAVLQESWFVEASVTSSRFTDADLRHSSFMRTTLQSTNLVGANLFRADFGEVCAHDCDYSGSNLYEANLGKANLSACEFRGANLTRSHWVERGRAIRGEIMSQSDFIAALQTGRSLSGQQFEGLALQGFRCPGADLRGVRLVASDLREAVLDGAALDGATFINCRMDGASFAGAEWSRTVLFGTSMRECCFDDGRLHGVVMVDGQLSGASFRSAQLDRVQFTRAQLGKADFSQAVIRQTGMAEATLAGAIWRGASLHEVVYTGADLRHCRLDEVAQLCGCLFGQADLRYARLGGDMQSCILAEAKLGEPGQAERAQLDFTSARVTATVLRGLVMEDVCWRGAVCEQVDFSECGLGGVDFRETSFTNCVFSEADLRRANFSGHDLQYLIFVKADLREALFSGAKITACVFDEARLDRADMVRANCRAVLMEGAQLAGLRYDRCVFSGVRLSGCDVRSLEFTGLGLDRCEFKGLDLAGRVFRDCDLRDADFGETRSGRGILYRLQPGQGHLCRGGLDTSQLRNMFGQGGHLR